MHHQQQQQQQDGKSAFQIREEEYMAARRAGAEAVEIGRETLEEATRQGEQLENAESMADETGYKLDKAGRVLRGMTWSGWVANMFAGELKPPGSSDNGSNNGDGNNSNNVPTVYDHAPPACRNAAQAVQNYHANLKVLATCETDEQLETAHVICENMYRVALTQINAILDGDLHMEGVQESETRVFVQKLQKDLTNLRSRQQIKKRFQQRQQREAQQYQQSREALELQDQTATAANGSKNGNKNGNFSSKPIAFMPGDPEAQRMMELQNQHLDGIAEHLDELGNIALNLGEATERQSSLIEGLDTKSDTILDKSRMVTRRADRLIQQKAWTPAKPTFQSCVAIQHVPTQKYLAVTKGNLVLLRNLDDELCIFEVWKRQGSIFGLQSKYSRKWVGQNILGNLECRATSFGRRQEFETEQPWAAGTPLVCASAGWGAGSYVVVRGKEETVNIATTGTVTSKYADLWCLKET